MCDDLQRVTKSEVARMYPALSALLAASADHISNLFFQATAAAGCFTFSSFPILNSRVGVFVL
jgi:hypothetical protein